MTAQVHDWCGKVDDPAEGRRCPCMAYQERGINQPKPDRRPRKHRPVTAGPRQLPVLSPEERRAAFERVTS